MQFEEIVSRLNRAGGSLQPIPSLKKDDSRAVQVEVFTTNTKGVLVKVMNTPDISLAGLFHRTDDGLILPLNHCIENPTPQMNRIRDDLWDQFYCSSVCCYRHGEQQSLDDYSARMVEFTNFVARELS